MIRIRFFKALLTPSLVLVSVISAFAAEKNTYVVYHSLDDPLDAVTAAKLVNAKMDVEVNVLSFIRDYESYYRVTSAYLPSVKALVQLQDARDSGYKDAWLLRATEEHSTFFEVKNYSERSPPVQKQPPTPAQTPQSSEASLWQLDGKDSKPASGASRNEEPPPSREPEPVNESPDDSGQQPDPKPTEDSTTSLNIENLTSQIVTPGSIQSVPQLDGEQVRIDGVLDESIWQRLAPIDNLLVISPSTLDEPYHRTLVRMFTTKTGLYVAAQMKQPVETLVQRLSARDRDMNRDSFEITLDTSGEGLFGFWFTLNLGGTKMDGKVAPERSFTDQWDGAWLGETSVNNDGWSAEIFIPWSIVTMPKTSGQRQMQYFVSRRVAYRDERYGWPGLTFNQPQFMSALQPITVGNIQPKSSWEVFPYIASTENAITESDDSRVGLSFSWRPSSNVQITSTLNPDFGAVESDDVVVNLTAYETFFPEKRLFFLEGSEVFITSPRSNTRWGSASDGARRAPSTYTPEPTTLLNTRRIGGAARHVDVPSHVDVEGTELSKPTDLLAAVKVVGQSDYGRYGLLFAAEDNPEIFGTHTETGLREIVTGERRNFAVGRWLIARTETGRQALGYMGTVADYPSYNAVVHGIDAHHQTSSGQFNIDAQFLTSRKEDTQGYGLFADLTWFDKFELFHNLKLDYLDDELDISDLGFLRRNDVQGFEYYAFKSVTQNLPQIMRQARYNVFASTSYNSEGHLIMGYLGAGTTFQYENRNELRLQFSWRPEMVDDFYAGNHGSFRTRSGGYVKITYSTDSAKPLAVSIQTGARDGPTGRANHFSDFGFTFSPVSRFSLDYDIRYQVNQGQLIHVGDGDFEVYETEDLQHIFSTDFFVTANQQLRMTFHWIGIKGDVKSFYTLGPSASPLVPRAQPAEDFGNVFPISRLTSQIRYRWEIAPLSDLFVVYTRGSNLYLDVFDDFASLLDQALNEPVVDTFVVKLRYRFGG